MARKIAFIQGNTAAAGGAGAALVWAWNGLVPSYPMDVTVGAVLAATVFAPAVQYVVEWLPRPPARQAAAGDEDPPK